MWVTGHASAKEQVTNSMTQKRPDKRHKARRKQPVGRRLAALAGSGLVHLTGILAVAVVAGWAIIGTGHLRWLAAVHQHFGDASMFTAELVVHFVLSGVAWGLMYSVGRRLLDGPARSFARTLQPRSGTVIVETLIVFPVLLLLVMGIAQLAVNNVAGVLLNYGASQGVHTAWLWESEVRGQHHHGVRMGVEESKIEEMARIQIAAAMTPVAPSVYDAQRNFDSEEFEKMRAVFLGGQLRDPPNEAGQAVLSHAEEFDNFTTETRPTIARSLDDASFPRRTVRKFTSAYEAVELEVESTGDEVYFNLDYHHMLTFPFVGPIFANPGSIEGRQGNFLTLNREFTHDAQIEPNAKLPRR